MLNRDVWRYLIPFIAWWVMGILFAGNTAQGLLAVYLPPVAIYHALVNTALAFSSLL